MQGTFCANSMQEVHSSAREWARPPRGCRGGLAGAYLEFINGYPAIRREVLEQGYEPLQAAVPVSQKQHQSHQVQNAHELAGHCEKLQSEQTPPSSLVLDLALQGSMSGTGGEG